MWAGSVWHTDQRCDKLDCFVTMMVLSEAGRYYRLNVHAHPKDRFTIHSF